MLKSLPPLLDSLSIERLDRQSRLGWRPRARAIEAVAGGGDANKTEINGGNIIQA
jgi:hypothetical protein